MLFHIIYYGRKGRNIGFSPFLFKNDYLCKMNTKEEIKLSKTLSYILRHKPEKFNIELDKNGWVNITELISKLNQGITYEDIKLVVDNNDRKRFIISDDNKKIRANQGHSLKVDLNLKAVVPPVELYHGTADKNINSIKKKGLVKGNRHHVHLSLNKDTAVNVGKRYGNPIVLIVDCKQMYKDNIKFYKSENDVWLTDYIDPKYIKF